MKKLLYIPFLFISIIVIGQSNISGEIADSIADPIRIGNLEVAQNNLQGPESGQGATIKMGWYYAEQAITNLGNGWRLPTIDELNLMYLNRDKIGGFDKYYYWSSDQGGNLHYCIDFRNGQSDGLYGNSACCVRAVRSF